MAQAMVGLFEWRVGLIDFSITCDRAVTWRAWSGEIAIGNGTAPDVFCAATAAHQCAREYLMRHVMLVETALPQILNQIGS